MALDDEKSQNKPMEDFCLGVWRVSPNNNAIYRDDVSVQLEAKAMATLVYLSQNQGKTCSSDELMAEVWSNTIVTDNTLRRIITQLRKALEDDAAKPCYIKTVPRKGYQIVAEVSALSHVQALNFWSTRSTLQKALSIMSLTIIVIWLVMPINNEVREADWLAAPITNLVGREITPSLSPDGRFVIYAHSDNSNSGYHLYRRQLNEVDDRPLDGLSGMAINPKISPDGSKLAFFKWGQTSCHVAIADLRDDGKRVENIRYIGLCEKQRFSAMAWFDHQHILLQTIDKEDHDKGQAGGLVKINVESQDMMPHSLVKAELTSDISRIAISHRDQSQAIVIAQGSESQLWLKSENSPAYLAHTIHDRVSDIKFCGRDNHLYLAFDGNLARVTLNSRFLSTENAVSLTPIQSVKRRKINYITCHPHSDQIIYSSRHLNTNLVKLTRDQEKNIVVSNLHHSMNSERWPIFANTSNRVLFSSNRNGDWQVLQSKEGRLSRLLERSIQQDAPVVWSPDDTRLLILQPGHFTLYHLLEDSEIQITLPENNAFTAAWSADGSGVYYATAANGELRFVDVTYLHTQITSHQIDSSSLVEQEKTSNQTIPLLANMQNRLIDSNAHQHIAHLDANDIAPDPSGEHILYTRKSIQGIWQYNLSSKQSKLLIPDVHNYSLIQPFTNGVYFNHVKGKRGAIYFYDYATQSVTEKFPELQSEYGSQFTVSPDQTQFISISYSNYQADLYRLTPSTESLNAR